MIFWKRLRRIGVGSSLNVWQNSHMKPFYRWSFFVGRFLIIVSTFLPLFGLFLFSMSSLLRLTRLYLSKSLSISSELSTLQAFTFLWYYLMILFISVVAIVTSLSLKILFIWVPFSPWWVLLKVYEFYLLQESAFSFINLSSCFVSISFSSALILEILSIYYLEVLLVLFSSVRLGCLFEMFLVSWDDIVLV